MEEDPLQVGTVASASAAAMVRQALGSNPQEAGSMQAPVMGLQQPKQGTSPHLGTSGGTTTGGLMRQSLGAGRICVVCRGTGTRAGERVAGRSHAAGSRHVPTFCLPQPRPLPHPGSTCGDHPNYLH